MMHVQICGDQASVKVNVENSDVQRGAPAEERRSTDDKQSVTRTYCVLLLFWSSYWFHFVALHQTESTCSVFSVPCSWCHLLQIGGVEAWNKQMLLCRCHYHGDYWWPPCLPAVNPPVSHNALSCLSLCEHLFCVIAGFHRLHSLSRVHSHRVCGLPGKQEDPPPQMVQICP